MCKQKATGAGSTWIWIVAAMIIAAVVIYCLASRNKNAGRTSMIQYTDTGIHLINLPQAQNTQPETTFVNPKAMLS